MSSTCLQDKAGHAIGFGAVAAHGNRIILTAVVGSQVEGDGGIIEEKHVGGLDTANRSTDLIGLGTLQQGRDRFGIGHRQRWGYFGNVDVSGSVGIDPLRASIELRRARYHQSVADGDAVAKIIPGPAVAGIKGLGDRF